MLNLSHNEMELISPDANMQVLTKLTTLILACNRFVVTKSFLSFSFLSCFLQIISFPIIPNSILNLPSLTTLSLTGNPAVPVPKQRLLEYIPLKIATLDFSNLGLAALPMEIGRLTSLNYLDVSNNKLKYIPPQIGLLQSLTYHSKQQLCEHVSPRFSGQVIKVFWYTKTERCKFAQLICFTVPSQHQYLTLIDTLIYPITL